MSMAETASNISAQAEADPISGFRINEKSVVPIWIQIRKRLVYLISSGKFERGEETAIGSGAISAAGSQLQYCEQGVPGS